MVIKHGKCASGLHDRQQLVTEKYVRWLRVKRFHLCSRRLYFDFAGIRVKLYMQHSWRASTTRNITRYSMCIPNF